MYLVFTLVIRIANIIIFKKCTYTENYGFWNIIQVVGRRHRDKCILGNVLHRFDLDLQIWSVGC